MFVYEIDDEHSIVLGAGLKDEWVKQGLSVVGLPTHYGTLSYSISNISNGNIEITIEGTVNAKKNPILIPISILSVPILDFFINGVKSSIIDGNIIVKELPAKVSLIY
jgi:hypothetical protein